MKNLFRLLGTFLLLLGSAAALQPDGAAGLRIADASGGTALMPLRLALMEISRMKEFSGMEFAITRMTPKEAVKKLTGKEVELIVMEMRDIPKDFSGERRNFAAEALVCSSGLGNPLRSLSIRQLKEIWSSDRPQWKKYSGEFNEISRLGLTIDAGGFVEARFLGGTLRNTGIMRCKDIRRAWLFCTPSSLLCAPYQKIYPAGVVPIAIDNIAPDAGNIISGRYPLSLRYQILSRSKISAAAEKFLALLDSAEYSVLISEAGLLKIPNPGEKNEKKP